MNLTTILVYGGTFFIIFPIISMIIYLIKCGIGFNRKIEIFCLYLIVLLFFLATMTYYAFNARHNLFLIIYFAYFEIAILSYFLLSLQSISKFFRFSLPLVFVIIIYVIHSNWGTKHALPAEAVIVESLLITMLGMLSIPQIRITKKYELGFYYFVFGILIASLNNMIGYGIENVAQMFSLSIHGIVSMVKYTFFTIGFYVILRESAKEKLEVY
ncbi:hypothetical protein ASZ90_003699 [hydrocarbon metagenome]|uniref:Uncharacterized protein n=1 Tax=hydrocarbon metagenome TaxID=938273 RepID=A0A0W8FZZ1_9ZZZZ